MANWLLDYIEMTEYIPPEFRDQSFSMRELDLKVSIAMSQLENDIREFFNKIDTFNPQEKQEQYEALVKKCDEASMVANTKVKIADRLHDLVEKSMRLLDQGLEKLKEDLIEGDKAYIVEDIERRSQELDEQLHLQEESIMQRYHHKTIRDHKATDINHHHHNHHHHHTKGSHNVNNNTNASNHRSSNHHHHHHVNQNSHHSTQTTNHNNHPNNHHASQSNSNQPQNHHPHYHHNRHRNNSTGTQISTSTTTTGVKQKKRERKRLNSAMTVFNRNSKTDDDSTNQTNLLSSPTTPDYFASLHSSNSNSLNDVSGNDGSCFTLKGLAGNRSSIGANDKSNGTDPLSKARQPILTAIDAAHAVSPNATNSDKLVLFSNNSNGDNYDNSNYIKDKHIFHQHQSGQLGNHMIPPTGLMNSGHNPSNINGNSNKFLKTEANQTSKTPASATSSPFGPLSRHDPIMMAASQAIHATQNMTPGRRTSSLKASYAAVNSGRLQHPNHSNHTMFDQANLTGEVYCKCRGAVHDPNMIACDNVDCKIEWFHYECVGITAAPAGEWYCDDCKGLPRSLAEHAANPSKHQQSRQAANSLIQATDTFQRSETSS